MRSIVAGMLAGLIVIGPPTALFVGVCLLADSPDLPPTLVAKPWPRVEVSGDLKSHEADNNVFAAGFKRINLYADDEMRRLAFVNDADYREFERHIGLTVTVRGGETWIVCEGIKAR